VSWAGGVAPGIRDLADVLVIERELARVASDIERLTGRRRQLDQLVELATVRVALEEPSATGQSAWAPIADAFRDAGSALIWSVAALVRIATFTAPLLAVAALAWLVGRRLPAQSPSRGAQDGARQSREDR